MHWRRVNFQSMAIVVLVIAGCNWKVKNGANIVAIEHSMDGDLSISSLGKVKKGMNLGEFEKAIAANGVFPIFTSARVGLSFYCTPRLPGKVVKVWYEARQDHECVVEKWTVEERNEANVFTDLEGARATI